MKFVFVETMQSKPFTPNTPLKEPLGGSQSAICYYVKELSRLGHQVILVGNLKSDIVEDGIELKTEKWYMSQRGYECDFIVLCTAVNEKYIEKLRTNFKYKVSMLWQGHYGCTKILEHSKKYLYHLDFFAFVSEYQRDHFCWLYNLPMNKTLLMKNGISPFFQTIDVPKKKDSFIYFSNPTRGLKNLPAIWKIVSSKYPSASLKVFSSAKTYGEKDDTPETKEIYKELTSLSNVYVHPSVGQIELAKECAECAFLMYPTGFTETSCIVCIESCAVGTIPIVTDIGVFPEYIDDCVHYGDDFINVYSERVIKELDKFYNKPDEYFIRSNTLMKETRSKLGYNIIVSEYVKTCIDLLERKIFAVKRNMFLNSSSNNDERLKLNVAESMPYLFENEIVAANYFLKQSNRFFNRPYEHSSEHYLKTAFDIVNCAAICNNLIIFYKTMKKWDELYIWFNKMKEYDIDSSVINKVIGDIKEFSLDKQQSILNYVISIYEYSQTPLEIALYNSAINRLAYTNRVLMKHENSTSMLIKNIQKLISIEGYKEDCILHDCLKLSLTNLIFNYNYSFKDSNYIDVCKMYEKYVKVEGTIYPKSQKINNKIRIGFISGDFNNHPVLYILNGFIEYLDKSKFEIFIYVDDCVENANSYVYLKSNTNNIKIIKGDTIQQAADKIYNDNIDILFDMCGHTSSSALRIVPIMRLKPAKSICNYFAYPNSTWIEAVDFKLGDSIVFNTESKPLFSETLISMKSGFHSYRHISTDLKSSRTKKTLDTVVFGIFNNPQKITTKFLDTVCKILLAVPNSKLMFCYWGYTHKLLQNVYISFMHARGIKKDRLIFTASDTATITRDMYGKVDISLDTFPYNGGTVNIESLYYDVPYITLLGSDYVSRVGASILTQTGYTELIASNIEEYVSKAVELANDKNRLKKYHETIHSNLQKTTLLNGKLFASEFEEACNQMLEIKGIKVISECEKVSYKNYESNVVVRFLQKIMSNPYDIIVSKSTKEINTFLSIYQQCEYKFLHNIKKSIYLVKNNKELNVFISNLGESIETDEYIFLHYKDFFNVVSHKYSTLYILEWYKNSIVQPSKEVKDRLTYLNNLNLIPHDHVHYLQQLKSSGFEPKVIYDIGACVLNWYNEAKKLWPDATFIEFDAFESAEFLYKEKGVRYYIGPLSNEDNREVKFYVNEMWPGGNSYYKEKGDKIFKEDSYKLYKTSKLDTIVEKYNIPKPDFIKIDVQGAEKDVIEGATNTIKHAQRMVIEMQHEEYNEKAPNVTKTLPYIESLGWKCVAPLFCNNGPDGDYGFQRVKNNTDIPNHIEKAVYINLDHRADRKKSIEIELLRMNISNYVRFPAIGHNYGAIGCHMSHLAVLKMARDNNWKNCMIIEDDFMFIVSKEELEMQLNHLFENYQDFDVVMLGYNMKKCKQVDSILGKVEEAQTASCYIVNSTFYDTLIDNLEKALILHVETKHMGYTNDQCWKVLQPISKWYYFINRSGVQKTKL